MADNNPYQSIMAGIGGATAIGGDIYGAIDRENNINTNISRFEGGGFTRPTLSLGDELGQLSSLRVLSRKKHVVHKLKLKFVVEITCKIYTDDRYKHHSNNEN